MGREPFSDERLWSQLRTRIGLGAILDAALPPTAFLGALALGGGRPGVPLVSALAVGAAVAAVRLVRREGVRPVAVSFAAVVLAAALVHRSGRAVDFFLPELALNAALAIWFALSLALRRPATATVLRLLGFRNPPAGQPANTAIWLGFWTAHVVLEVPLYLAGNAFWLGVIRVATGPLLWLPVAWVGWRAARRSVERSVARSARGAERGRVVSDA